ncbi:MAG: hypothetical protein QM756_05995 [Polyangiaceae bacterium]
MKTRALSAPRGMLRRVAHSRPPQILLPGRPPTFPDPRLSDARGLVAAGGELSPDWLLGAYERGIFPWYDEGLPILWWSPESAHAVRTEFVTCFAQHATLPAQHVAAAELQPRLRGRDAGSGS